jgi:hypothetical protein
MKRGSASTRSTASASPMIRRLTYSGRDCLRSNGRPVAGQETLAIDRHVVCEAAVGAGYSGLNASAAELMQ